MMGSNGLVGEEIGGESVSIATLITCNGTNEGLNWVRPWGCAGPVRHLIHTCLILHRGVKMEESKTIPER